VPVRRSAVGPLLPLDLGHVDPLHILGGGQIAGPDLRQGIGSGRVVEGLAIGNNLVPASCFLLDASVATLIWNCL